MLETEAKRRVAFYNYSGMEAAFELDQTCAKNDRTAFWKFASVWHAKRLARSPSTHRSDSRRRP